MPLISTFINASRRGLSSPVAPHTPSSDGVMAYQVPASYNGTNSIITSIGSDSATMSIVGPGTTYVAGPPAYVSVGPLDYAEDPNINDVSPSPILSLTQYGTISFWCWMPSFPSGEIQLTSMSGPAFDGIFIKVLTSRFMTFTTNGAQYNNVVATSSAVFEWSTWQMITFTYTLANNPSTCWVNDTQVLSFNHPAGDFMNVGTYGFIMACSGGRWNQVNIYANKQITQAEVTAKFTAERGYYGV